MKRIILCSLLTLMSTSTFAGICNKGDKAQVAWKGSWYPATVLKAKDNKCLIHYDGYGSSWDEWVGANRIKITSSAMSSSSWEEGDPVNVLWKGTWYPAHVLKVKGNQLKIHYDGYESSWDEWVGPDRYK